MAAKEPEAKRVILVHYHEIGLKGHNRKHFEKRLKKNLEALAHSWPVSSITIISGRLLLFIEDGCSVERLGECLEDVARVPGVARVSLGFRCERAMEVMGEVAKRALAEAEPFQTFKVNARRAHTDFPIDSMQMNRDIGEVLYYAFPQKTVKMKHPDVEVRVEVIQSSCYIYARSLRGIGGLPVGTSGRMCCLLSSGIDSPVATWRMARRGAVCIGVHFSGRPQTSDASEYLVDEIAQVLERSGCIAKVYTIPFGDHQRKISLDAPPSLRVILYRRLMMKVAQRIAQEEHAGALVTGESLGQVASQTLENITCTDAAVSLPVFRPLIGTDKQEIIAEAHQLGTYDISTQDAPDCCTLFMPRSPETHGKLQVVEAAEEAFPLEEWVEELTKAAEVKTYRMA